MRIDVFANCCENVRSRCQNSFYYLEKVKGDKKLSFFRTRFSLQNFLYKTKTCRTLKELFRKNKLFIELLRFKNFLDLEQMMKNILEPDFLNKKKSFEIKN